MRRGKARDDGLETIDLRLGTRVSSFKSRRYHISVREPAPIKLHLSGDCTTKSYSLMSIVLCLASCVLLCILCSLPLNADVYDPLGNRIFEGRGESLYSIDATYGLIEGGAVARRERKFRDQLKAEFVTFGIGDSGNVWHEISVGGFRTEFSSFTLNKRQSDAIGWTVAFPQSRGKMSTFISKLTNTTTGREDTTIESSSDWYMAGARGEANLGIWDVTVGNRDFALELPTVGVSYVNKYFTNYNLTRTSNPFEGVVEHNPPEYLYVKFTDGSPENEDGARVFEIKLFINNSLNPEYSFIGGQEPPGVLIDADNSLSDGKSRWVGKSGSFVYRFFIPNSSEVESARFEVDVANDYVVGLSTDNSGYRMVLSAKGNVMNGSNRGWRTFYYGDSVGESTLGVDVNMTIAGVAVEAERSWLIKSFQFPSYRGQKSEESAGAWFVDANRRWGPFLLAAEYTYIDPFYNASDFLDDDDDNDGYLDGDEPFLPDVATENDLDGDRIMDWEDDFLLFRRDQPKFRLGLGRETMDFNNNGEPDIDEDDTKPEYRFDYEEGSQGYRTYLIFEPFVEGLTLTEGYYRKSLILDKKTARTHYILAEFVPRYIPNFGTVQLRFLTKRAHDIIPDDLVNRKDNLALQNSLSNIVTLIADYGEVQGLTLRSKLKYQYDADFHGKRRVIDTILINQARYDIKVGADTVISPAYRNDKTIGYTIPREADTSIDAVRQAFILQGIHEVISGELTVSAGVQYLTFRDLKNPRQNFNRRVGFLALALQGNIKGKGVGMLGSLDYVSHSLSRETGGSFKSTNIAVRLFLL